MKYDGVLFSCPINKMGQKKFAGVLNYDVWKDADPVNEAAVLKMFGGTDVSAELTAM